MSFDKIVTLNLPLGAWIPSISQGKIWMHGREVSYRYC